MLLSAASVLSGWLVLILWTMDSPGWWFSLLFTVLLVLVVAGFWAVYSDAVRSGRERARAQARWLESSNSVRSVPGVIMARDVATLEDGRVHRFAVTVALSPDVRVSGLWHSRASDSEPILQSQVPGVGAAARFWHVPGSPADWPFVIETVDPTVVVRTPREDDPHGDVWSG
ncbi:hypothetical protein GCM10027416_22600 [Okibacterium endophyticum]